jgi:hypothetical protein
MTKFGQETNELVTIQSNHRWTPMNTDQNCSQPHPPTAAILKPNRTSAEPPPSHQIKPAQAKSNLNGQFSREEPKSPKRTLLHFVVFVRFVVNPLWPAFPDREASHHEDREEHEDPHQADSVPAIVESPILNVREFPVRAIQIRASRAF